MKRFTALAVAAMLLCTLILTGCGGGGSDSGKTLTLNVYNWGEYISDGSEDSFNTVREFEKWYEETYKQKVKVNYTTFASNEDMYAKLSSGAVSFDVVIPSDYMIARMREENMLLELDFKNIPNYENIDQSFRGLYYDPDNKYTVPYTYGVVGVIYNANVVDEADAGGWDLLWNDKYKGDILQFNNSRDAFGTAQYKLGLDVNDTDQPSPPTTPATTSPCSTPRPRVWISNSTTPSAPTTSSTPCASPPAARTRSLPSASSTTCSLPSPPSPMPSSSTMPPPIPWCTRMRAISKRWARKPWRSFTPTSRISASSTTSTPSAAWIRQRLIM